MTYRPTYSFLKSIYFFFRVMLANMLGPQNRISFLRRRSTFVLLDADNAQGVRQFVSYSGKSRKYYIEAVWGMQLRNNDLTFPSSRKNVWKALEECDNLSNDILRVVAPDLLKK